MNYADRTCRTYRAAALAAAALALSLLTVHESRACTARDSWAGHDKTMHLAAGAAIGAGVTLYSRDPLIGTLAGTGVGLLKELRDSRGHGHCSLQDAVVTALGAAAGAYGTRWALSRSGGTTWLTYRIEI